MNYDIAGQIIVWIIIVSTSVASLVLGILALTKDNRKFAILAVCFGIVGSLVAIAGFVCGLVELAKLSKQPVTKPNAKNKKNTPKRRKVTNKKEVK